jgi:formylglycine-generating enzyme required for sulfatase activity
LPPANAPAVITTLLGQIPLKLIPAGEFWMGSPDDDPDACDDEKPRRMVEIRRAFCLGVTPLTQGQYEAVLGTNPSHFGGRRDHTVENATWFDAVAFCNKLSRSEALPCYYLIGRAMRVRVQGGAGYRLPTEAEWEYACRAGSDKRYCYGDDPRRLAEYASYSPNSAGGRLGRGHSFTSTAEYASCSLNSAGGTCSVRRKKPNAFGLYDMHGNVWEWCWDGYDRSTGRWSPDVDPLGMERAASRVVRGGSWNDDATDVRSASRYRFPPDGRFNFVGFRIARGLPDR